ncbi:MAG: SIS domain-containing protein [Candidatus Omnitrophota bacterium]
MKNTIRRILQDSIKVKENVLKTQILVIEKVAREVIACLKTGHKIIFLGNGGSAADSQHLAAELVGRFQKNRRGLAAISLNVNTSVITALANDYGYEYVFSKQLEALAEKGDLVIAISTSGNAKNVIMAVKKAGAMKIKTIGLTGGTGGDLTKLADTSITIASKITARIQEAHICIGHIICELVEEALF